MILVRSPEQIAEVVRLAREIWLEHYVPIIGRKQVDYMLEHFQSAAAVAEQLANSYEYYLTIDRGHSAGYAAVVPNSAESSLFLSKLYVRKSARGAGLGRQALLFIENLCRQKQLKTLWLTVNKHNASSIEWYSRMGFRNAGSIVQDIGGGFVMDDFRMEKMITPLP